MTNLERMIALADEFFEAKSDPDQILVNEEVIARLRLIHPATMGEVRIGDGPVAWMLVIPTTEPIMQRFLDRQISERTLLDLTIPGTRYEAIYLCSALVLPEHRGKGLAKQLALSAIRSIAEDHTIAALFYWGFSEEGRRLADAIGLELGLPVLKRGS
jgi:GNAT superfamily N-acetyltransferase